MFSIVHLRWTLDPLGMYLKGWLPRDPGPVLMNLTG